LDWRLEDWRFYISRITFYISRRSFYRFGETFYLKLVRFYRLHATFDLSTFFDTHSPDAADRT
jgi:hypothetical protein